MQVIRSSVFDTVRHGPWTQKDGDEELVNQKVDIGLRAIEKENRRCQSYASVALSKMGYSVSVQTFYNACHFDFTIQHRGDNQIGLKKKKCGF